MANPKKAIPENADGNYFVDSTCFNCGVSRHYAPEIFGDTGEFSFVKKQPETKEEILKTQQALLACPTASIGMREKVNLKEAEASFPVRMAGDVYVTGFNSRKSYGGHSYFIQSESGNWLIDSPRFVPILARKFEEMGGLKYIFLTHQDDVADADQYAKHFGATRIMHQAELKAQPDAEWVIEGEEKVVIDEGRIMVTPGHTKGHMVLLWQSKYLFTGDHFSWSVAANRFGSWKDYCWYSWEKQIESVRKMKVFTDVEWVFPGHGKWHQIAKGEFPAIIDECSAWMEKQ